MSKGLKRFLKILYYLFTFGLGVLLAISLPGLYMYDNLAKTMNSSLEEGNYANAMKLIGGYYDMTYAFQEDFIDDSGIVIFRAATLKETPEGVKQPYYLQTVYAGFLYKVKDKYITSEKKGNNTKLIVYNKDGQPFNISLLNYDEDNDLENDSISTLVDYNYVYFEIPEDVTTTISRIKFVDKNGDTFKDISIELDFNNNFFISVKPFLTVYNKDSASSELNRLDEEFRGQNQNYLMGNFGDVQKESTKKATIVVLIYFIWVYILGDCLVGKRYLIHFGIYLYRKIRKKEEKSQNVYGTDYYTKLTTYIDNPNIEDANIEIVYKNDKEQFKIILNKENGYKTEARVHAGNYECLEKICDGYEILDLPSMLEVSGYQMDLLINIKKL